MAIKKDITVTVENKKSIMSDDVWIYQGDKNIDIYFTIIDNRFEFSTITPQRYSFTIRKPDGNLLPYTEVTPLVEGKVKFTITETMTNELSEVGMYDILIHLYDDLDSRVSIPEISFEVKQPLVTTNALTSSGFVESAVLDSINDTLERLDANGNYVKTVWNKGDVITKENLNKIENQLVDLSTYNVDIDMQLNEKAPISYVDMKIGNMGNVKTFKGSCLYSALPSNPTVDDYWYVTDRNTNYCWNGTAWVDIGNNLNIGDGTVAPSKTTFFSQGKNYIDYSKTVNGQFINQSTGTFDSSTNHRRTEKLRCMPNTKYTFSYRHKTTGANIANNVAFRYATYTDKTFISGSLNTVSFTTPANANYIAISWLQSNDSDYNIQLEEGNISSFENYTTNISERYLDLSNIKNDISLLNEKVDNVVSGGATNIIFNEDFKTVIPSFLTNNGFTLNNGLVNSSVGYDKQLYYNKEVCLDKELIKVDVELKNLNSIVGVGFRSAIAGLLCEADFKNKKLIIRQGWSDPTTIVPPNIFLETPITFDLLINKTYSIIVEKDTRKNCSIKVIDVATLNEVKLDCVEKSTTSPVNAWGGACIVAIEGSFKVNRFTFINNQPSSPLLAIYGDSFIEGTTLMPNIEKRYAQILKDKLNGDCIIGGKGGETTKGIIDKIETYSKFRPKHTILAVGLNDTVFSAYQERIVTLINWCDSIGSTPILATITRNMTTDNLAFLRQVNDFVRNSGYRYVDFAKVMSINGDGETQDTSLFLADKIHPSILGHEKMYKKTLVDLYDILNIQ